jgi:hypothetical protein
MLFFGMGISLLFICFFGRYDNGIGNESEEIVIAGRVGSGSTEAVKTAVAGFGTERF